MRSSSRNCANHHGLVSKLVEEQQRTPRDSAIDSLVQMLNVSVIPNTHVFLIQLEKTSPDKSSRIVNTLSDTFVTDKVQAGIESTSVDAE